MAKKIKTLLSWFIPLCLGIYLFWVFFDSMTEDSKAVFYSALKQANYFWIFLSMGIGFLALLSRAYRWKYMLEPLGFQTSFWHRYHALMIGYVMNLTIPRAGEAVRAMMLHRSDGIPFAKSFGTILAERVFDMLLLLVVFAYSVQVNSTDLWNMKQAIELRFHLNNAESSLFETIVKVVFVLGFLSVLLMMFFQRTRSKIVNFAKGMISGVLAVFKSKHPWSFLTHTIGIWIIYILCFWVCFFAFPETSKLELNAVILVFLAGTLGIALTNGGIGVFPLLVGMVVDFYLQKQDPEMTNGIGNALGLIIWSSQTLMIICLGVISLFLLPKNYKGNGETA